VFDPIRQSPSTSKLSRILINAYTVGSSNIVRGGREFSESVGAGFGISFGNGSGDARLQNESADGKLVVRVYSPKTYSLANDADCERRRFLDEYSAAGAHSISPSDRALIDYLEGPNEGQNADAWVSRKRALQASQWFNQFWTNLTRE